MLNVCTAPASLLHDAPATAPSVDTCLPLLSSFSSWVPVPTPRLPGHSVASEPALPSACPGNPIPGQCGCSAGSDPSQARHQCHLPSAILLVPSFSEGFGPLWEKTRWWEQAGFVQLPSHMPGPAALCGLLTECLSLPSVHFTRNIYLRTGEPKP